MYSLVTTPHPNTLPTLPGLCPIVLVLQVPLHSERTQVNSYKALYMTCQQWKQPQTQGARLCVQGDTCLWNTNW